MTGSENILKTYEELTEWRKKAQEIKRLKDTPSTLLGKIHTLAGSISAALRDTDAAGKKICHETNDIKYQFDSDDSLRIGKESVRPLIELKNIATEVFADTKETSTNDEAFTKDVDFGPAYEELEKMRRVANRSREFIKQLNSAIDGIEHLENGSEKTCTSESTLSSEPSTSDFSLFENSKTNVATSSPISKS